MLMWDTLLMLSKKVLGVLGSVQGLHTYVYIEALLRLTILSLIHLCLRLPA